MLADWFINDGRKLSIFLRFSTTTVKKRSENRRRRLKNLYVIVRFTYNFFFPFSNIFFRFNHLWVFSQTFSFMYSEIFPLRACLIFYVLGFFPHCSLYIYECWKNKIVFDFWLVVSIDSLTHCFFQRRGWWLEAFSSWRQRLGILLNFFKEYQTWPSFSIYTSSEQIFSSSYMLLFNFECQFYSISIVLSGDLL
jgi:hypothetical protein